MLRYTSAPPVFFGTAARAFLPFQAARLQFSSPEARFLAHRSMQRGSVFFLKLASCIAVFGGAWHANNPIEGIGIDQLRILPVFQIVSREGLSVHVASYFGKFLRKDRKTSEGRCRTQCSSQVEVNCSQTQVIWICSAYGNIHVKRVSARRSTWTEMP